MQNSNYQYLSEPVEFSPWFPWNPSFSTEKQVLLVPGLYLLARFSSFPISTNADPLSKEILYIGESTQQTIWKRLDNFRYSAMGEAKKKVVATDPDSYNSNHPAGFKYRGLGFDFSKLYFSYFSPSDMGMDHSLQGLFIKFLERKLLFEFAFYNGDGLPILNGE